MGLSAGDLRERITIETKVRVPDGAGGHTVTWAELPSARSIAAKVIAKAGTESVISDRIAATFTTLFIIRNRSDLDPTMRIKWRGIVLNIRGFRAEGYGPRFLTIEAEGGVA